MAKIERTLGVILSGGEGRRMGGTDKGLVLFQDKPLIAHVIDRLSSQVDDCLVIANRNIGEYRRFGLAVVQDSTNQFQGPMAGLEAALSWALDNRKDIDKVLVSSCDTPHLPANLLAELLKHIQHHDVAVAHDGRRRQNLHCLIRRDAWRSLIDAFINGERALWQWQNTQTLVEVDFSEQAQGFANFNTLDDLDSDS